VLRGIAASLVVVAHSIQGPYAKKFWVCGYFGVATFFIISGFIIYTTSRNSFGSIAGFKSFAAKRFVRIFPIYWIATALFVVCSPHLHDYTAADVIDSLLLIPHWMALTDGMNPLLGQGWTLHYEVVFYFVFAITLLFNRKLGVALTISTLIVMVIVGGFIRPESDATGQLTLAQYWCRPIIILFVFGIGMGVLREHYGARFSVSYPARYMLALLAIWFGYCILTPLSEAQDTEFPMLFGIWVLCFLVVFVAVFGRSRPGLLESIMELFGDASYSVYLFHPFILSALIRIGWRESHPNLFPVAAVSGANLFGLFMYRLIEKPILTNFRRRLARHLAVAA
jgi:exopolysaccharide production protein ExoZ